MKKVLFLLLLLFPFMVSAVENVKITNIEQLEKSDTVTVNTEPTFEGLKINFDFKFTALNDFIKYKVTIKNEDTKEYEIESGVQFNEGEFIKYEFGMNGESAIIKPNETKDMTLLITYIKEPNPEMFVDGKYVEQNAMSIDLSSPEEQHSSVDPASEAKPQTQPKEDNPKTGAGNVLIFITILLVAGVLLTVAIRKKDKVLLTLALLLIPVAIHAIEKITLEIETKVEIEATEKTFIVKDMNCGLGEPTVYEFEYRNGMTWAMFKASDYYTEGIAKYTAAGVQDINYERIFPTSNFAYLEEKLPQCYKDLQEYPEPTEDMTEEEVAALYEAYQTSMANCSSKYPVKNLTQDNYIISSIYGYYYYNEKCLE